MIYLTRVEHFNAAHKLENTNWSDEKNLDVFGKCANANWHGHNYELHVTVKGEPNKETGFVFNAKTLGTLIKEVVIEKVDHRNLNLDVDFMKGIWNQLKEPIAVHGASLHSVKLIETKSIYVEYFGE